MITLFLAVVALAAMVLAVAMVRRPLICCPAAGLASGTVLVLAAGFAAAGQWAVGVAALLPGLLAARWGLAVALDYADRCKAAEDEQAGGAR